MAKERKGIEVSIAIAEAVAQANVDVIAAYPITPQTHIVEHLADIVAEGELDAEFIPVDSEHSAMSVCCGSAAVGARTSRWSAMRAGFISSPRTARRPTTTPSAPSGSRRTPRSCCRWP